MKLKFKVLIQGGRLVWSPDVASTVKKAFEGLDKICVEFSKWSNKRSGKMNAYYWGVIVPIVCNSIKDAQGDVIVTNDLTHEFLKSKFLPLVTGWQPIRINTLNKETGEVTREKEFIYSSALLTNTQFIEYFTLIQQWASEVLGVYVPDPNEEIEDKNININKK